MTSEVETEGIRSLLMEVAEQLWRSVPTSENASFCVFDTPNSPCEVTASEAVEAGLIAHAKFQPPSFKTVDLYKEQPPGQTAFEVRGLYS